MVHGVAIHQKVKLRELSKTSRNIELRLDKNLLVCHPEAQQAYMAWDAVHKVQTHSVRLFIPAYVDRFTLPAVSAPDPERKNARIIQFVSHFNEIRLLRQSSIDKYPFRLLENANFTAIREHAWFEVIQLAFGGLDPKTGWASWRDVINQLMPEDLIEGFFGKKRLTNRRVCEISGMHSRSLDRQVQRLRKVAK